MNRSVFEMHWQYYLSIEKMLAKTNQYVMHSDKNKNVYSDEFASIILLSCSELDSLFKQLCINCGIQSKGRHFNINDYAPAIQRCMSNDFGIATSTRTLNDDNLVIIPFNNINAAKTYANLHWWKDYQLIKHDRIKNVAAGNLLNAVSSVAAHFLVLRELIEFIDESRVREYLKKNCWTDYWIPAL
ncbi:hypothetical protein SAMN04487975_105182 [Planococcus glaciei]|uniref:hypothetical protein n=1 Tax=Planococcus glaciei TaxID=459472 RepID=UPI00088D7CC9|nr:hypothetical protein [Planococcus glaciei]SDH54549.1 hypothetical protein SAMN04487975_105182 [Planococcus glaciei]